jgi:hypothetical protein
MMRPNMKYQFDQKRTTKTSPNGTTKPEISNWPNRRVRPNIKYTDNCAPKNQYDVVHRWGPSICRRGSLDRDQLRNASYITSSTLGPITKKASQHSPNAQL